MCKSDHIRCRHMLDAALEAVAFAQGRTREDLDNDRQLVLAILKDIEIVGEAASNISESTRRLMPDMPWSAIVGMRNRLVHAYFAISLDIVWQTVESDLPPLISLLEDFLSSGSSDTRCQISPP